MGERAWTALGLTSLVGCLMLLLGPGLLHPWRDFVGTEFIDTHGTLWFFWWLQHALEEGKPLLHTDMIFAPWGKDLYSHTGGNLLDALFALPLRRLLGPVAGMNLWLAVVLATNGASGWWLARAWGAGRTGAWAAAMLALCQPFALRELDLGRPTQAMLVFLGLWLASLAGAPTWKRGLWGGLCLGLSGLCYWYYGLLGALIGLVAAGVRLGLGVSRPAELLRLGLAVLVAGVVTLPAAWPMLQDLGAGQVPGLLALGEPLGALGPVRLETMEGDLQAVTIVSLDGRAGSLLPQEPVVFQAGIRVVLAIWGAGLLLALRGRRDALVLGLAWILALGLIALGPAVVVGQSLQPNPVYQALVEHLDLLRRWWWPGRAIGPLGLVVAGLSGLGVAALPTLGLRRLTAALLALGALVGVVGQGVAPLPAWTAETGPGIRCLAEAEGALVELPWEGGQRPLYHQTVHGLPVLNGMLITKGAFVPPELTSLMAENALLRQLVELGERRTVAPLQAGLDEEQQELLRLGYRWVVFRKEGFDRLTNRGHSGVKETSEWPRTRRLVGRGLGDPAFEDEQVAIYSLDGSALGCP